MRDKRILILTLGFLLALAIHPVSAEKVIVVLKDQPSEIRDLNALKTSAFETQKDIVSQIKEYKRAGKVKEYKQLWLINAIVVDVDRDVIEELRSRPDVAKVILDYKVSLYDVNFQRPDFVSTAYGSDQTVTQFSESSLEWNL